MDYVRFWLYGANLSIACNHFIRLRLSRTYCFKRVAASFSQESLWKILSLPPASSRLLTSIAFHSAGFPPLGISWPRFSNCISRVSDRLTSRTLFPALSRGYIIFSLCLLLYLLNVLVARPYPSKVKHADIRK